MDVLTSPLTEEETQTKFPDGLVDVVIALDLDDLIDNSLDTVLDLMNEKACVYPLSEINYRIVGFQGEATLLLQIEGECLNMEHELIW